MKRIINAAMYVIALRPPSNPIRAITTLEFVANYDDFGDGDDDYYMMIDYDDYLSR